MLRIHLLGPFRAVLPSGESARFAAQSAAAVLALLALRPDHRLTREMIAQTLWPDHPTARAAANARQALWRLRGSLGDQLPCLMIDREEVLLESGPDLWIDLDHFRATGDPEVVLGHLLEGWTDEWVVRERELLMVEVNTRLASAASAALASGEPQAGLACAQRLVSIDPLREDGHRLIMAAYLALNQPASALQQYQACRSALSRELGVEPTAETARLAQQARSITVTTQPGSAAGRTAESRQTPLIGRREDLRRMIQVLTGPGPTLGLITGEPGIGKSRLIEEVVREAHELGFRVLRASCYDGPTPPPHQVLADLLRSIGKERLQSLPAPAKRALALIVPELGTPVHSTPGDERHRLLTILSETFQSLLQEGPVLFLLEDIQWSDPASIRALEFLAPRMNTQGLRMIGTCRTDALAEREDIAQGAFRQESGGMLQRVDLQPLDQAETARLAHALAPEVSPLYSTWLYQETAGNPLFITELVRATTQSPERPPAELPAGILRVLRWRLTDLSAESREILRAAAVLGESFGFEQLRGMLSMPEEELVTHLDLLLARGLLIEHESGMRFYHARFRDTVLTDLTKPRRLSLHRRAARIVSDDSVSAYHAEAGEDWRLAAERLRTSARRAFFLGEHTDAITLANRAVAAVEKLDRDRAELEIAVIETRAEIFGDLGRYDQQSTDLDRLERLALQTGNHGLVVLTAAHRSTLHAKLGRYEEAETEGRRSLLLAQRPGMEPERLLTAQMGLVRIYQHLGRWPKWIPLAEEALANARQMGSLIWEGRLSLSLAVAFRDRMQPGKALPLGKSAAEIGRRLDDFDLEMGGYVLQAASLIGLGQPEEGLELYRTAAGLAGQKGAKVLELAGRAYVGFYLRHLGRWEEAAADAPALYAGAITLQWARLTMAAQREMAWMHLRMGRADEALKYATAMMNGLTPADLLKDYSEGGEVWARALLAAGDLDGALAWARAQHPTVPGRHPYISLRLSRTVAEIHRAANQVDSAQRWERWQDRWHRYVGDRFPVFVQSL